MKKSSLFILLTLLAFVCLSIFPIRTARAWQTTISDCSACGSRAEAAVVDAAGDIIATGSFFYGADIVKLSGATGEVKWRSVVMGHESRNYVQDIAIDSHGDVFVVFAWTRTVIKVSGADGTKIWDKPIGGTLNALLPLINAVVVDRDDNVITAGTMGGYFNVGKLDGRTGDEKWHYDARGGYARGVAVGRTGEVAAAGMMNNNFATVKLSADGHEIWYEEINGEGSLTDVFEEARAVRIGDDGSVVAAGVTVGVTGEFRDCTKDFTVAKYFPDGTRWIRTINGSLRGTDDRGHIHNGANDEANAVTIDNNGDVIVAGSYQVSPEVNVNAPEHFQVFKLSGSNGQTLWGDAADEVPPNQIHPFGSAFAISVDAANDVAAAGVHAGRFTVVKFLAATSVSGAGQRAWPRPFIINTGAVGGSNAVSVLMDADRNVVAAGETIGSDGWSKFTVVKIRGTDGTDYFADPTPTPIVPETVVKYAPLVYLHPEDKYRPGNPMTFINNSSLHWFHEGGCPPDNLATAGMVQAGRLGEKAEAPYSDSPIAPTISGNSCDEMPEYEFKANHYTRPWDGGKRSAVRDFPWNHPFYEKEGFYLDLVDDESIREGNRSNGNDVYPGAPVFYEYVPHRYVTYWFFYPFNRFPVTSVVPDQAHEGDWERISISLDSSDNAVLVHYYQHKEGVYLSWDSAPREGDHVLVFSAIGSHASYPIASGPIAGFPTDSPEFLGIDHTEYGPKWRTWNSLSDVTTQSWYGYGGAWGRVSTVPKISTPLGELSGAIYTGPLGPSGFKNSVETWFKRIGGRVTDTKGNGLIGVTVSLSSSIGVVLNTILTGPDGHYSFENLTVGGSYAIFPKRPGYSFSPVVETFANLTENKTQNFIGEDLIPPILQLPANMVVNADHPQGSAIYYTATATDNVTQNPRITCTPPSGNIFHIGTTTVSCTAIDDAGLGTTGSFKIIVRGAADQISDLITLVKGFDLHSGTENSLVVKLQHALAKVKAGGKAVACNQLGAFINEVQAQTGKKNSGVQSIQMLNAANQIRAVLGC